MSAAETFSFVNLTVPPGWALLIFLPRWKWTRIVAAYAVLEPVAAARRMGALPLVYFIVRISVVRKLPGTE